MSAGRQGYIAVGDIHGCPTQLEEVLRFSRNFPQHQLVFLGDYIDRGPDSEGVINRLRMLDDAVFLMGNHEEMFFNRLEAAGDNADEVYARTKVSPASKDWMLQNLRLCYETEDYIFVHAGLNPEKGLQEQTKADYLWTIHEGDYLRLTSKLVVHGHRIVPMKIRVGNRLNINTGCGNGGQLTLVVLPEMRFLSSTTSPSSEPDLARLRQELEQMPDEQVLGLSPDCQGSN